MTNIRKENELRRRVFDSPCDTRKGNAVYFNLLHGSQAVGLRR